MQAKGKLLVLEAGDGSGKATQTKMLRERLVAEGRCVRQVEFPDYASPSSALVRMYLGGDFGERASEVNAYAASAFFAVDRRRNGVRSLRRARSSSPTATRRRTWSIRP